MRTEPSQGFQRIYVFPPRGLRHEEARKISQFKRRKSAKIRPLASRIYRANTHPD